MLIGVAKTIKRWSFRIRTLPACSQRSHNDGTSTAVERFAYDGWDTAKPGAVGSENFDVWADLDDSNDITMRRMYGAGFDNVIGRQDGLGNVSWYGTDRMRSVRLVFDNAGTVTGTRDYTAFGAITSEVGAGLDRIAYTSREWDAALGLQYHRARMYQVDTGTWTTEDPIGFSAGDANLFRYVGNAVTMYTDPSGMQTPSEEERKRVEIEFIKKQLGIRTRQDIEREEKVKVQQFMEKLGISFEDLNHHQSHAGNSLGLGKNIKIVNGTKIDMSYSMCTGGYGCGPLYQNNTLPPDLKDNVDWLKYIVGITSLDEYTGKKQPTSPPVSNRATAQFVLDIAGFFFEPADIANAGIYAYNSEYTDAAITGVGAVPIFGIFATLYKWGKKADNALDAVKAVKAVPALDATAERTLLKSTAEELAHAIKKGPFKQSNTKAGAVLTVIRDRRTGELFDAQNLGAIPDKLHPLLQSRLNAYLKMNGGNLKQVWGDPGSHSEIAALNQALLRREALGLPVNSLEEFSMYNVSLWNNRLGTTVPRCGNCQCLTDGVQVLSGK